MVSKKETLALIAELLGDLRSSRKKKTRNFVYYWVKNTIHVIVEEEDDTIEYRITSAKKFVKEIQDNSDIFVTEISLQGFKTYNERSRSVQTYKPGEIRGCGLLDWETEETFSPRESITRGLKRILCVK